MTRRTRRRFLRAASVGGVVGVTGCLELGGGNGGGDDEEDDEEGNGATAAWPLFQHDAGNTGNVPDETGPETGLTEQWTFEAGGPVKASPVVGNGTVYVGSNSHDLYAIDAAGGEEQWAFQTDDKIVAAPAVVDGTVYVGSFDGNVYAVDAESGEEQWRFETDGPVASSPTVVDGTAYVGSRDGNVYAIRTADGEGEWGFPTEGKPNATPAVGDSRVYATSEEFVYGLDAESGDQAWRYGDASEPVLSSLTLVGGTVYFGTFGNYSAIYALSASDGNEQWTDRLSGNVLGSLAVADGILYYQTDGNTQARDAASGNVQWTSEDLFGRSSPVVVDGKLYVGGRNTGLAVVEPTNGNVQQRFEAEDRVVSAPAVVDGTAYVTSLDARVYALAEE